MKSAFRARITGTVTAALVLAAAAPAHAGLCKDLPDPVYELGANAVKPLIAKVGAALTNASPPTTLIFQGPGQCVGLNSLIGNVNMTGTASYWDAAGKEQNCDLGLVGSPVDVALMNSYASLCPNVVQPATVGDFLGPIQSFNFIVPKASNEVSISAAAAYLAYGLGTAGEAAPWVDEAEIFRRDANSGVSLFVALALGIPVSKLKGIDAKSNANTVTLVSAAANPQAAIGIVSGEVAEANIATVTTLAYQHTGQTCGYWPNSTASSFDKRNIRDGHYFIWSPIHFFATVDGTNTPVNPGAAKFVGYFSGKVKPPANVDIPTLEIKAGTVPDCAMEVKRTSDLGDVQSYAPAEPCGCFFDFTATGKTTCQACVDNNGCGQGAPNCRYGFCEVN